MNLAKQDEMKRLKDLREKFYTHAHAASKEDEMPEETRVPIVEQPPVIEHDNDEPEEEDTEEREEIEMTKEQIKNMMETTGQKLIYEDDYNLEYENPMYGEPISFEFDSKGLLYKIYS